MQVVLDMREKELEERRLEAAKIMTALRQQEAKLEEIINSQNINSIQLDGLYNADSLNIQQVEGHRDYGIKLAIDAKNQERIINNTKMILERKQIEVREAHKKAEILKKLKEKQEKQYYKDFLDAEIKETDDITTSRFRLE